MNYNQLGGFTRRLLEEHNRLNAAIRPNGFNDAIIQYIDDLVNQDNFPVTLRDDIRVTNINDADFRTDFDEYFSDYNPNYFRSILNGVRGNHIPDDLEDIETERERFLCKKQFYDLSTDFVSKITIFNDNADTQILIARFQYVVNYLYNKAINKYLRWLGQVARNSGIRLIIKDSDIVFLFKGGTTMKILFEKYKRELCRIGRDGIEMCNPPIFNLLQDSFGRSDSDYSILINPKLNMIEHGITFEKIYYDINKISFTVLNIIRNIFNNNGNNIIPLNRTNNGTINALLVRMNEKLQEVKAPGVNNCEDFNNIIQIIGAKYSNNNNEIDYFLPGENIPILNNANIDTTLLNLNEYGDFNQAIIDFRNNRTAPLERKDIFLSFDNQVDNNINRHITVENRHQNKYYLSMNETNEYIRHHTNRQFLAC